MRSSHDVAALAARLGPASRLLVVVLLVLASTAAGGLPAGAKARPGNAEERRLGQTRARIAQVRAELDSAQSRQRQDAHALAHAEQQLATVLQAVGAAEQAVQRQQQAVEQARAQLADLEQREAAQRALAAARAVALYKSGSGVPFSAILDAATPGEALDRSTYVDVVARLERESFERLHASQVSVDVQRRELEEQEAALARVLAQQRALLADVEAVRKSKALRLAAASSKVANLQAQERHLEAESRQIAALSRRASRTVGASRSAAAPAAAAPAVRAAGGGWVWPARGPVTSGYGRRWGRMHQGIDIGAPTGAPIVAARGGTVSFAGRMSGYGNLVLVNHGDGIVTAYAHQSRIMVSAGQSVGAGQRIGSIGCTGNCTGPHLHFEVRVNGSPRNPMAYL